MWRGASFCWEPHRKDCELSVTDAEPPIAPESDVMPEVMPRRCEGVAAATFPRKLLLLVAPPLVDAAWPCGVPGCATEMTDVVCANGSDSSPYDPAAAGVDVEKVEGEASWSRKREPPPREAAAEAVEEGGPREAETRGACVLPPRKKARARAAGGGRWLAMLVSVASVSVVTPSAQLSTLAGPGMLVYPMETAASCGASCRVRQCVARQDRPCLCMQGGLERNT